MRIALVHDYLNQYGGAERVLEALSEMFPAAPIHTLFYDPERTFYRFAHRRIITSPLNYAPFVKRAHRAFIPFMPLAASSLSLKGYDLVISSSASYAKGVKTPGAFHLCYCHTPLRYAWEDKEYLKTHPLFTSRIMYGLSGVLTSYLRSWDKEAASRVNAFVANSNFIAGKILAYYDRDAVVVHPPVDTTVFYPEPDTKRSYFLAVGRMLHYKRFDLIIDAFDKLQLPLRIVGGGPELEALRGGAKSKHIEFLPYIEDLDELRKLYSGAKALVFPQVEDFGLVAAEAIACGTPVIAYRKGGAQEIVEEGISGTFFDEQTSEALVPAVEHFNRTHFTAKSVARSGQRFSKERFKNEMCSVLRMQGFTV